MVLRACVLMEGGGEGYKWLPGDLLVFAKIFDPILPWGASKRVDTSCLTSLQAFAGLFPQCNIQTEMFAEPRYIRKEENKKRKVLK